MFHTLYKKLLSLYPRRFKDQVGESMEQTFNDLYRERHTERRWSSFVLWIFVETAIGILRERILWIQEMNSMKNIFTNLISPAIISFLVVLPFMILEWATRSDAPRSDASLMLWVVLWFLSTGFMVALMPIVRNARDGNSLLANPGSLLFRLVFFFLFAWLWGALVIDQMPCFLGGSGC